MGPLFSAMRVNARGDWSEMLRRKRRDPAGVENAVTERH
jgi:hypothetical protein